MAYPEESILEKAINEAMTTGEDAIPEGAIVVGWVIGVAYKTPEMIEEGGSRTAHAYFAPSGQAAYSTFGILSVTMDWIKEGG